MGKGSRRSGTRSRSMMNSSPPRADGDSITQRILDRLEEEYEARKAARIKKVTLPRLKCLEDT